MGRNQRPKSTDKLHSAIDGIAAELARIRRLIGQVDAKYIKEWEKQQEVSRRKDWLENEIRTGRVKRGKRSK